MSMNRRDFVRSATALSGVMVFGGCKTLGGAGSRLQNSQSAASRVRHSVYSPYGQHLLEIYNQVVGHMKATKHGDKSLWELQADIHYDHCPHGNWFFLPWHRVYVYCFEEICRDIASSKVKRLPKIPTECYENWTLPYWDWHSDKTIPSAFFEKEHLKAERAVQPTDRPSDQVFSSTALESVSSSSDFYLFASAPAKEQQDRAAQGSLEASPHNTIHVWLGGEDKPMATMRSPLDPIFWTHHCNVDRMWLEWTRRCMDAGMTFEETLPPQRDDEYKELTPDYWRNYELKQFWIKNPDQVLKFKVADTIDCVNGPMKFSYDSLKGREPAPYGDGKPALGLTSGASFKPLQMSVARISDVKEGFVINEDRGTIVIKFMLEANKQKASDLQLIRDTVGGAIKNSRMSSVVLQVKGIRIADERRAREMLLHFTGSYVAGKDTFHLGTTGFFVQNHHGAHGHHGHQDASVVDLQIDMLPLVKSLPSANAMENRVITITIQAVQARDPRKATKMDRKMFEGTSSEKVTTELEFRLSRRS